MLCRPANAPDRPRKVYGDEKFTPEQVRRDEAIPWQTETLHIGVADAQVWNDNSVDRLPAFMVAAYSLLLLASLNASPRHGRRGENALRASI